MSLRGCDRRILSYLDWTKMAFLPFFKCFPQNSASQSKKSSALTVLTLFLFFFPNQCFHVPYSALTMFISSEQKERDSATAYSEYHRLHGKLSNESPDRKEMYRVCVCHLINISRCFPHQGWRWRFWELFLVQPSRGRSWAWRMLPAYQDPATS